MNYLKISEIALKCEVKQNQIVQLYLLIGRNTHFSDEVKSDIYKLIEDVKKELEILENKLKKLTI